MSTEANARWRAAITYRTEAGPLEVGYDLEELHELQDLVERGPDWNTIEAIHVTLVRQLYAATVEAIFRG